MKSPPVQSFHTDDLGLAAFVRCRGHTLKHLEPSNGERGRYRFVFDLGMDEGDGAASDYYNRGATVTARLYFEEMGVLKRLLAQQKQRAF